MTYDSRHRSAFAIIRRCGLFVAALLLLVLFGGADAWRTAIHCSTDSPCVVTSDDVPAVTGDMAAIVELSDDVSSDGPVNPSDKKAHKDAAAAARRLFAMGVIAPAAIPDRQWRARFPDKTGPPRA